MRADLSASRGTPEPEPMLIDVKAASALLSMGERKLWDLTNSQAIPSRKIGRSVRYAPSELRAWIEAGCPTEAGSAELVRKAART